MYLVRSFCIPYYLTSYFSNSCKQFFYYSCLICRSLCQFLRAGCQVMGSRRHLLGCCINISHSITEFFHKVHKFFKHDGIASNISLLVLAPDIKITLSKFSKDLCQITDHCPQIIKCSPEAFSELSKFIVFIICNLCVQLSFSQTVHSLSHLSNGRK